MQSLKIVFLLAIWGLCSPSNAHPTRKNSSHQRRSRSQGPAVNATTRVLSNEDFAWEKSGYMYLDGGETYAGAKLELEGDLNIYCHDWKAAIITLTNDVTYTMTTHSFRINNVLFKPATAQTSLTSSLITATTGRLSLSGVTFEGITLASCALLSTPNLYFSTYDGSPVTFKDITRTDITGGGKTGGSVLEIVDFDEAYFSFSSAVFDNCQCPKGKGGAIYIKVSDSTSYNPSFSLSVLFQNVKTNAATSGLCTYIDFGASVSKDDIDGGDFVSLAPLKKGYHVFVASDVTTATDCYTLFESMGVFVDHTSTATGAVEDKTCGNVEKACLTIAAAVKSDKFGTIVANAELEMQPILLAYGEHSAETTGSTIANTMQLMGGSSDPEGTVLAISSIASTAAVFTIEAKTLIEVTVQAMTFRASAASSTGVFSLKSGAENVYGTLALDSVIFENSAASVSYSTPVIDATNGYLSLYSVKFNRITLTNCPLLRINTGASGFTSESSRFNYITRTTGNGVVLEETLKGTSALALNNLNFENDVMCANGIGLMFFTVDSTVTQASLTIGGSIYGPYSSKGDDEDYDDKSICRFGFKADTAALVLTQLGMATYLSEESVKTYYGVIGKETYPLIYFTGHPTSTYYITTATENGDKCGWEDLPCGPFSDSYAKVSGVTSLVLLKGTHAGKKLELSSSLLLRGSYDEETEAIETTYTVSDGITFTTTSSLQLASLIISPAASFTALTTPLINSLTGFISLSEIEFRNIVMDKCSLISCVSLSSEDVLFKSISRKDTVATAGAPGPSVFNLDLSEGGSIPLSDLSFESCSGAANGVGGAVYIKFPADLSDVEFESSVRPFKGTVSTPDKGKYIYFDASSVTSADFIEAFDEELRMLVADTNANYFTVKTLKEAGKTDTEENDLFKLLGITQLALTVDATARTSKCTTEDAKCMTLELAAATLENYGTGAGNSIAVSGTVAAVESPITFSKGVAITGSNTKIEVSLTNMPDGQYGQSYPLLSFESEAVYTLSKFTFAVNAKTTETQLHGAIISVSDEAQLTISSTTFTSAEDSKQCYTRNTILSADGKLILSGVTFSYFTLTERTLLDISEVPGYFSIASTTVFSNIIRSSGDGSVISRELSKGDALVIENAEFTSCKTLKGNGGALSVDVYNQGSFTLKNCKFTSCAAGQVSTARSNADGYRGGAVYLSVSGTGNTVTLADLTVSGCKANAENGGNALFCVYYAKEGESVPESFWKDLMKGISDPADGDYVGAVVHEEDEEEDFKPINLAEYADDDDGFPTWAIILIVVVGVVIIAVVVVIIIYCLKCRKAKVDANDKTFGDGPADNTSSPPAEENKPAEETSPSESTE